MAETKAIVDLLTSSNLEPAEAIDLAVIFETVGKLPEKDRQELIGFIAGATKGYSYAKGVRRCMTG